MGGFTLPALSIQPPANPLDRVQKALSIRSLLQGQQLQQQQIVGATQENQLRANQIASYTAYQDALTDVQSGDTSGIGDTDPIALSTS